MTLTQTDPNNSILVVIDFQEAFRKLIYQGDLCEAAIIRSIKLAELFDVPVVMTEQYPKGLGKTTPAVAEAFSSCATRRGEVVEKLSFSCAGDENFQTLLESTVAELRARSQGKLLGPTEIVVVGIETHVCVLTTCLDLIAAGYKVQVLEEAVTSRYRYLRENGLAQLRQAGVRISNTETIAFEWAKSKEHEKFKQMSNLLKQSLPIED